MTEGEMNWVLEFAQRSLSKSVTTAEGVVFLSEETAKIYADQHDKIQPVRIGGGWLTKNRKRDSWSNAN